MRVQKAICTGMLYNYNLPLTIAGAVIYNRMHFCIAPQYFSDTIQLQYVLYELSFSVFEAE